MKICVVGLGNIGFNLFAYLLDRFSRDVVGVDVDGNRIRELEKRGYPVTQDYTGLADIDVWLMAPSTGKNGENLFAALAAMAIRPGALISIESTLPPGTMKRVENYLQGRGFRLGTDLFLIHVPHRVMFGVDQTVCDTPRVMGAFTEACLKKGREFYAPLVPNLVEVSDIRVVELSKIVENVKRHIDVAFAEEIYRYCTEEGLDFAGLRRAVNSKENVELLGVDWGIGGECLPKDLDFLRAVFSSPLLEGAERADRQYRERIAGQVGNDRKVLVRGLSYKPGIKDLRHSRGVELLLKLEAQGNIVWAEDSLFSPEELAEQGFRAYDLTQRKAGSHAEQPDIILLREQPLQPIRKGDTPPH